MTEPTEILELSLVPEEGATEPYEPARWRPSLVAVLVAALVLVTACAGVLGWMITHAGPVTDGQQEAITAVEQYSRAFDQHDLRELRATLAERATFSGGEHLDQLVVGPFSGRDLDDFYTSLFRADVRMSTDGPVQVTGSGPYRVAVVQTVHYTVAGVPVTEQAVSLFTLIRVEDRPVILEHVWWRPLAAQAPSMLWAR